MLETLMILTNPYNAMACVRIPNRPDGRSKSDSRRTQVPAILFPPPWVQKVSLIWGVMIWMVSIVVSLARIGWNSLLARNESLSGIE